MEKGTLPFTYDFPAFYEEMIKSNLQNIGPGGAMILRAALLAFKQIGEIAIRDNNKELLEILNIMGVIEDEITQNNP
mgnify:CR=1 FL=1